MKRLFCAILTLIICVTAFASCHIKETDIYEFLNELCEIFGEDENIGKGVLYAEKEVAELNVRSLTAERFGRLYIGKNEPPPCFSRIEGYAIRIPTDESGFEIHIIKCVNRSDTAEIANMLSLRIEALSSAEIRLYAPDTYLKYFKNAEIFSKGKYVFLLATPNNEKCIKMIKNRSFR